MTFALDVSDDFVDVVDNHEAVTVRPPIAENANAELVTNGRFDSGLSGWSPNGATWEDRLALCDISAEYLGQAITTVADADYIVAVDVFADWSSTAPAIKVGTSLDGAEIESNAITESGRLIFEFTATGTTTYLTLRNGDKRARFGGVSVRAVDSTSVANALRRAITDREAAASQSNAWTGQSGGKYRKGDVRWHIAQDELTAAPKIGSVITDGDSVEWTVLAVDEQTFLNRWRCWCRRLSVADEALGYVSIEKDLLVRSPSGAEKHEWQTWAKTVAARIQPQAAGIQTISDRRVIPERVTIYTKHQFPIDQRFRIVGADSRIYKVQGYAMPQQIGDLFAIEAEVNPWGLN